MKPVQLHIHFPFSYWQERDPRTGAPLQRPRADSLHAYLQCLAQELGSMREDYADCEIRAIRFCGGYLSLLDAEELETLLILIHRCFSVVKDCPVSGLLFPGSLDLALISAYRNHRVSPLLFEVPSLSYRECERLGLPVVTQALDQTVYFLQSFREEEWGLRLPIGIPGRTEDYWRFLLGQLYHYHPKYLQFFTLDPTLVESPAFDAICGELTEHGYRRHGAGSFALAEALPPTLAEATPADEFVGVGLGAISQIDGFLVKNTVDLSAYTANCRNYRKLIQSAAELG